MNRELSKSAQQWADHLLALGNMEHSEGSYGENLFFSYSSSGINLSGRVRVRVMVSTLGCTARLRSLQASVSISCVVCCFLAAGKEAVESWYGEIKDYDFSKPGFSGTTGNP